MSLIELPRRFKDERAVQRGKRALYTVQEQVKRYIDQGRTPLQVRVSKDYADDMVAYFCSWSRFDGVLPRQVHGVPFHIGGTGGQDLEIVLPKGTRDQ